MRRHSGLHFIRLMCFVAVCLPNCTRCCPTGFGSCQCNWAWENCPANNGCNSCGTGSAAEDPSLFGPPEASAPRGLSFDAALRDEPGGTLAFVATDSGTFAVTALVNRDEVRVLRIDASAVEEEQIIVRTVGVVPLSPGDAPTRVVADGHGHAVVALSGASAVAMIDPLSGSVVSRQPTCATPRALAVDSQDALWVGCEDGAVIASRLADGAELQRRTGAVVGKGLYVLDSDAGSFALYGDGGVDDAVDGVDAWVANGDAYVGRQRVGTPGVAMAVATAEVSYQSTTRRVLAVQTAMPHMLAFYVLTADILPVALEPLE